MYVESKYNAQIGAIMQERSYWAVKLASGDWISDLDEQIDVATATHRHISWYQDIVLTEEARSVRELWLFCPATECNPLGNRARLVIPEPSTAFVLNGKQMPLGFQDAYPTYQIIGKVVNKEEGICECFVWDHLTQSLYQPYYTSVYDFKPWRTGAAPLGRLSLEALGIDLR